jgi:hypothetical protein
MRGFVPLRPVDNFESITSEHPVRSVTPFHA